METGSFRLASPWPPSGDQPQAIEALLSSLKQGHACHTLMGVTGSGKTFTVANVIQQLQKPTLVLAHNKTLAAQLYSEFKAFFPENAVHYFVSYYDYYQPEAYLPGSDTFIEKDASINDQIERMRLATTKSLIERRDVIVVASVSCIYGMGKRENYEDAVVTFNIGEQWQRRSFLKSLMANYYERNDLDLRPGTFRVRGDVVELYPVYSDRALRFSFFDEELERIDETDPVTGHTLEQRQQVSVFPAQHYVTSDNAIAQSMSLIEEELQKRLEWFRSEGFLLEVQRLESRTRYDMEMLSEAGYCSGIENYSRYLDGRKEGEQPGTLLDFFPADFLMVVDESHITLPQVRGMFNGDRARKEVLVQYGFRLPSCLDNRPLKWHEFEGFMRQVICCSATPGDWEMERSSVVVEQVIRPTGIVDPEVILRPATGQVDDLLGEIRDVLASGGRVLVTTLTKKSSEDLAGYLENLGIKAKYIHSELNAFERAELIADLRSGTIEVLVGINLLREGIDMPEVTLVAILDADREGFLRSYRSLIQVMGRAARNVESRVLLYGDHETDSIKAAMGESRRRREKQLQYNEEHHIVPVSIQKEISSLLPQMEFEAVAQQSDSDAVKLEQLDCATLEKMMWESVKQLRFEQAARLRDMIAALEEEEGTAGKEGRSLRVASHRRSRRKRT